MKTIYRKTKKQWRLNALNLGVFKEIFGLFMIKIQTHGHGHRVPRGTLLNRLFTSLTPEINRYTGDVSQLDIEVSGRSRLADNGGVGGRSSSPWDKGGTRAQKKFFLPLGLIFGLKIRGAGPLGPSPGFATGGAMIWNSLPNNFKEIKSLQLFKRKLQCFVQQKCIDST